MTATTRAHSFLMLVACACLGGVLLSNVHCSRQATGPASNTVAEPVGPRHIYGQTVVIAQGAKPALTELAGALMKHLTRATGAPFRVARSHDRGIFLLRSDAPDAPPDIVEKLRGQGREAYFIRSQGRGKLLIVANAEEGLAFGAYQLLERLGFRFYFPSDKWTIVPRLHDIELSLDLLVKPAFLIRRFEGTGGLGGKLAIDPEQALAKRWATWKQANGFGEEFKIAGHVGEAFNRRYKELLLRHPEYLASVDGKRMWSKIAKLDPTNPDAVSLFVKDRLDAYRELRKRDPGGASSVAISVDAADGGGHCNSAECLRIGGASEQQFFFANAVARELAKEFPDALVTMHAYNLHADVPNLAIEPNVYVMIVPYAFRRDDADPESFIKSWARKKSPLSLYDYWSIPDWVADAPVFDFRITPAHKLRFWSQNAIEGFGLETSYSAGAMGLGLYIAGHLAWDVSREPKRLAEEFVRDSFGEAAAPMRRLLDRWASGFMLGASELGASFVDLSEALRLARSADVKARLADYAAYLQYLRLRYEFEHSAPEDEPARKRALLSHIWRIYDTGMVASYRLARLLARGDKALAADFDPHNAKLAFWKTLVAWEEHDARRSVADGLARYPARAIALKAYAGALVPATSDERSSLAQARALMRAVAPAPVSITLMGSNRLELTIPPGVTNPKIELQGTERVRARILDGQRQELASVEVEAGPTGRAFETNVQQPGTYFLEFRTLKMAKVTISAPADIGVELQEFRIPKPAPAPDLYFFVPKGETRIGIHSETPLPLPERRGPVFLDGSGNEVPCERLDSGRTLVAMVPPGQDGRIWALRRAVAPTDTVRLLNAPQRFALSRAALRVPAAALVPAAQPRPARR